MTDFEKTTSLTISKAGAPFYASHLVKTQDHGSWGFLDYDDCAAIWPADGGHESPRAHVAWTPSRPRPETIEERAAAALRFVLEHGTHESPVSDLFLMKVDTEVGPVCFGLRRTDFLDETRIDVYPVGSSLDYFGPPIANLLDTVSSGWSAFEKEAGRAASFPGKRWFAVRAFRHHFLNHLFKHCLEGAAEEAMAHLKTGEVVALPYR